ncbi:MAG: ATP-binding cassette domain-containing protein, partial [Actinomycetota bacterium]
MSTLELSSLGVEVAGLPILEDLTASFRPGDKVGIVGRNGAGKTSLLRVLAGEDPPLAGAVHVRGTLGYLRQDPRQRAEDDARTALAHLLDARGLDAMAERLEKERLRVEEHPSEANVGRYAKLEQRFRDAGGYAGEAEARR